jgi:hypothetical protein
VHRIIMSYFLSSYLTIISLSDSFKPVYLSTNNDGLSFFYCPGCCKSFHHSGRGVGVSCRLPSHYEETRRKKEQVDTVNELIGRLNCITKMQPDIDLLG